MVDCCDCGVCGDCNAIDLVFFCYEVRLQIWVQAGVSAGIWVIHTAVPNLGAS